MYRSDADASAASSKATEIEFWEEGMERGSHRLAGMAPTSYMCQHRPQAHLTRAFLRHIRVAPTPHL